MGHNCHGMNLYGFHMSLMGNVYAMGTITTISGHAVPLANMCGHIWIAL